MMCHKVFNAIIPKISTSELLEGSFRIISEFLSDEFRSGSGSMPIVGGKQAKQYETNVKPR